MTITVAIAKAKAGLITRAWGGRRDVFAKKSKCL